MTKAASKASVAKIIKNAQASCAAAGLRFTDQRRDVLEIIAGAKKPLGAYDVLEALSGYMDNPKPPNAYRAIEFLAEQGFIHRIESLNAYVACSVDHRHGGSQFLVCDDCGEVIEAHLCHLPQDLEKHVKTQGFRASRWNAEIHGSCKDCARR